MTLGFDPMRPAARRKSIVVCRPLLFDNSVASAVQSPRAQPRCAQGIPQLRKNPEERRKTLKFVAARFDGPR
jgi:hypothetical protein